MKKIINQERQRLALDKQNVNLMVKQTLPNTFNKCIWDVITLQSAGQFLQTQLEIMRTLLADYQLFSLFFTTFYNNHERINNWYLLAHENKQEIKQYVFKSLLSKDYKQYRFQMKDKELKKHVFKNTAISIKQQKQNSSFQTKHQEGLYKKNLTKLDFRRKKDPRKIKEIEKSLEPLEQNRTVKQIQKEDYHELFLKTFLACDGHKYIYYDFHKHMKGNQEANEYNKFIRVQKLHKPHNSLAFKVNQVKLNSGEYSQSQSLNNSFYFHEQEESLQNNLYNTFTVDPIGYLQKPKTKLRQKNVFRKMPNCFKRAQSSPHGFKAPLVNGPRKSYI